MKKTKTISNGNGFELFDDTRLFFVTRDHPGEADADGNRRYYIGRKDPFAPSAMEARDAINELVGPPASAPKAPDPSARAKFMAITQPPFDTYIDMEFTVLDHWPSAELGTAVKDSQWHNNGPIEIWKRVAVIGPKPDAERPITYDQEVAA